MTRILLPEGYHARVLEEVDSTNAEAARIAAELTGPTWILARRQTQARGRRGRAWAATEGNFSATLVIAPLEPPEQVALRSFVAAVALHAACVEATGRADVFSLKWPNDVLCRGRKLAGILLESIGTGGRVTHLSIGIGVNLQVAPEQASLEERALPAISLSDVSDQVVTPEAFLAVLARHYAHFEAQFAKFGFAPIRTGWLAHAAKLGETITARLPQRQITGTFETVDEQGHLVLKTAKGRETVSAADIFF